MCRLSNSEKRPFSVSKDYLQTDVIQVYEYFSDKETFSYYRNITASKSFTQFISDVIDGEGSDHQGHIQYEYIEFQKNRCANERHFKMSERRLPSVTLTVDPSQGPPYRPHALCFQACIERTPRSERHPRIRQSFHNYWQQPGKQGVPI